MSQNSNFIFLLKSKPNRYVKNDSRGSITRIFILIIQIKPHRACSPLFV